MDVDRIIRTHVSSGDSGIPAELLSGVESGQVNMLSVVKGLGEYLTSTEDDVRLRGVRLLSDVLAKTAADKVNRQATQTLTNFLSSLLTDGAILPPVLQGLITLVGLKTFGDGEATQVYRSLVENVKMRSFVQSTRYLVFRLVDKILATHRSAMKKLGQDFTTTYVKLAEGEKDPRNLMLGFAISKVVLVEFDEWVVVEDMFDITFCYFPITFKPPPSDPYGITPLDLKLALRSCLSATPRFGLSALPLFIEKLSTSLGEAKRDVLQTLKQCLPVYGEGNVRGGPNQEAGGFIGELWEGIKVEILFSPDKDVEQDALDTFQAMIETLYPNVPGGEAKSIDFAQEVIKECQEFLKEPEKSKAKAASKILGVLVRTSPLIGRFALSQVLPQLFRAYHIDTDTQARGANLVIISDLLEALRVAYTTPGTSRTQSAERSIEVYRDELISILTSGLDNPSPTVKTPALHGLLQLTHIPGFLTVEEIAYAVQRINPLLIHVQTDELRDEAIKGLSAISLLAAKPVEEITLPLLFGKLPDYAPTLDAPELRLQYSQILTSLAALCVSPSLFETLVRRILAKLDYLCDESSPMDENNTDSESIRHECNVAYAYALLDCLLKTLKQKVTGKHVDVPKYFDQIVPRIFSICVAGAHPSGPSIAADARILKIAASITETMTRTLSLQRQNDCAQMLLHAYKSGSVTELVYKAKQFPQENEQRVIQPFSAHATVQEQNLVILFAASVIALRGESEILTADSAGLLQDSVSWSLDQAPNALTGEAVAKAISSIINKRADHLADFLTSTQARFWDDNIASTNQPQRKRVKALSIWIWITKGLVIRSHPAGLAMIARVFQLLESGGDIAEPAARKLAILANVDFDGILTKDNHANYKPLHKQKLANFLLPALVTGCSSSDSGVQHLYMIALGSLIRLIPRSMIMAEMQQVLPLLMRSLSLPSSELRANVLEALVSIIEVEDSTTNVAIQSQAKTLVTLLLGVAIDLDPKRSSERTRIAALRCLSVFPDAVQYNVLHSIKSKVVRDLQKAIDDPKRLVRKEAVDTRAKWFGYGAAV